MRQLNNFGEGRLAAPVSEFEAERVVLQPPELLPTAALSCQPTPYPANRRPILPTTALSCQPKPYPANRNPIFGGERLAAPVAEFEAESVVLQPPAQPRKAG